MSEKLQKILAQTGLGSRREMEKWIQAGRVVVNGQPASLGDRVELCDKIMVDGRIIAIEKTSIRVIVLNKPEGLICSRKDDQARSTVFDILPSLKTGRWISVGRLDLNTSGLLLFTNDGEFANALMHPSSQIEREYLVRVFGEPDDAVLTRLLRGVKLEDGMARFDKLLGPRGTGKNQWFTVMLKEGRKREVRRLWESQGFTVSRLKRVRFGNIKLSRSLKEGETAELSQAEITALKSLIPSL